MNTESPSKQPEPAPDPVLSQRVAEEKKSTRYVSVILSVFAHVVLLTLIGGAVIVQQILPKSAPLSYVLPEAGELDQAVESEEAPLDKPPESPLAEAALVDTPTAAGDPASGLEVIAADSPSSVFSVITGSSLVSPTLKTGAVGGGGTAAEGSRSPAGIKKFKIFNQEVESGGIGVILDISRTTHLYFPLAVKEVEKNFVNAPTVLVMGCGMNNKAILKEVGVVPFSTFPVLTTTQVVNPPTVANQLGVAQSLGKDTAATLEKMKLSDKVWVLNTPPGQYTVTQVAFEKLVKEGVDTIYWFTDFDDKMEVESLELLKKSLNGHKIKLIAHNFTGKPVPDGIKKVALESGGSCITVIPGKS